MGKLGKFCPWIRFVRSGPRTFLRTLVNASVGQNWCPPRFPWSRPSAVPNLALKRAQRHGISGTGLVQVIAHI
jgi:hypothetical protein